VTPAVRRGGLRGRAGGRPASLQNREETQRSGLAGRKPPLDVLIVREDGRFWGLRDDPRRSQNGIGHRPQKIPDGPFGVNIGLPQGQRHQVLHGWFVNHSHEAEYPSAPPLALRDRNCTAHAAWNGLGIGEVHNHPPWDKGGRASEARERCREIGDRRRILGGVGGGGTETIVGRPGRQCEDLVGLRCLLSLFRKLGPDVEQKRLEGLLELPRHRVRPAIHLFVARDDPMPDGELSNTIPLGSARLGLVIDAVRHHVGGHLGPPELIAGVLRVSSGGEAQENPRLGGG
jgi:hypothetical protein